MDDKLLCRVCLQEDEFLVGLSENVEELQTDLRTLLELCGNIKVDLDDAHPKYLCQTCTDELLIAAKFRNKCAEAQKTLIENAEAEAEAAAQAEAVTKANAKSDGVEETPICSDQIVQAVFEQLDEEIIHDQLVDVDENDFIEIEIVAQDVEVTNNKTPLFNCDTCGAHFFKADTLQRHIIKAHPHAPMHCCKRCDHPFTEHSNLMMHSCTPEQLCQQTSPTSRPNVCVVCGKGFQNASNLAAHMRMHNDEHPYTCDVCSKGFKTHAALVGHQKRHMQIAKYKCPNCGKIFVDSSNLRRHITALHTTIRPHICSICNRGFSRVYLLQLHLRTHTGERPYKCSYCTRSFAQQSVLRNHERTHTGERPHRCGVCDQSFGRPMQLKKHKCKRLIELKEAELKEQNVQMTEYAISDAVVSTDDNGETVWSMEE